MLLLACFMADEKLRSALKPINVEDMHEKLAEVKKEVDEETAEDLANLMANLKIGVAEEEPQIVDLSSLNETDISRIVKLFAFLKKAEDVDLTALVETFTRFSEFGEFISRVKEGLPWLKSYSEFQEKIDTVKEAVGKKFRMLILIDLGGSIFFRTDEKGVGNEFDFKFKKYKYFYRPGYAELLLTITKHPRTVVAFYSSMMRKTITPVMHELLGVPELESLKQQIGIFDREYCSEMRDFKYYNDLADEPYATFRDLQKIFDDDFCKSNGFNVSNTLLIDSDSKKV